MKLKSIQFTEDEGKPEQWRLEDCTLSDMNLIVGKNATGKTRTLNAIATLTMLLADELKIMDKAGNFSVIFDHNGVDMHYLLSFADYQVIQEELWQGDKLLLQRQKDGTGKILTEQLDKPGDYLAFQPPANELAVVSRRDAIQHPFLEHLYQWGKSAIYFQFGTPMGQNDLVDNQVVAIFKKGQQNNQNYIQTIINDMQFCGYKLENISLQTLVNLKQNHIVKAKMYNYLNSQKIFDSFKFTGLGNFDFFSSNYYLKEG